METARATAVAKTEIRSPVVRIFPLSCFTRPGSAGAWNVLPTLGETGGFFNVPDLICGSI
jgi:hypothetical protein